MLALNAYGTNLGDQAIYAGLSGLLGDIAAQRNLQLEVDQAFLYTYDFDAETVAALNDRYDLIIVGGGGVIFERPHDHSPSGWGLRIPSPLLHELRVPLAIYAVAYNYLEYGAAEMTAATREHLQETLNRSVHFSVREEGSRRFLHETVGLKGDIQLVPDAAIHVKPAPAELPELDPGRPTLALCLRLDRPDGRFPPPLDAHYSRFMSELLTALNRLMRQQGFQVLVVPHLLGGEEVQAMKLMLEHLPVDQLHLLPSLRPELYRGDASFEHAAYLAGVYARADVVLGQRMHAMLLAYGVGTPVVSMASISTNIWMREMLQVPPEHHIDVRDFDRQVRAENLESLILDAYARREALGQDAARRKAELIAMARRETEALVDQHLA